MSDGINKLAFVQQCDIASQIVYQSLRANEVEMGAAIVGCLMVVGELIAGEAETDAKFNEDLEQAITGLRNMATQLYNEAVAERQQRKH